MIDPDSVRAAIRSQASSAQCAERLLRQLHSAPLLTSFVEAVDESPYSLGEWVEAMDTFLSTLQDLGRQPQIGRMIGYLACCAESQNSATIRPALVDVFREMFDAFGFDG